MYKYELHAHTSECDLAARLSARDLVRLYKEKGYDGMVITDHYFKTFFDWFENELSGLTHEETVRRWLKGYYTAREEGERIGFTVLPGAEVRVREAYHRRLALMIPRAPVPRLRDARRSQLHHAEGHAGPHEHMAMSATTDAGVHIACQRPIARMPVASR